LKTASIVQIKKELQFQTHQELVDLCLKLGKFKVENKSLLTYLLFESHDEDAYIISIKEQLSDTFNSMNTDSYHYMKKTIRKILRQIRTFSKYSNKKETEVELLLFFCEQLNQIEPSIHKNNTLRNLYERQIVAIEKKIELLHEDLQYDYITQIQLLKNFY
jgi:hypothetical protein